MPAKKGSKKRGAVEPLPDLASLGQMSAPGTDPPMPDQPLRAADKPKTLDPIAAGEFTRLSKLLDGQISRQDANLLGLYCRIFSRWVAAENEVSRLGLVVRGTAGEAQVNPYLTVANNAARLLISLSDKLGLSPASRGLLRRQQPRRQV